MEYTVKIEDVFGGTKIELIGAFQVRTLTAFAARDRQVPQRVKDLFEVLYPKKEKKSS